MEIRKHLLREPAASRVHGRLHITSGTRAVSVSHGSKVMLGVNRRKLLIGGAAGLTTSYAVAKTTEYGNSVPVRVSAYQVRQEEDEPEPQPRPDPDPSLHSMDIGVYLRYAGSFAIDCLAADAVS